MHALPYIIVLAGTTLVAFALAWYAWRQRRLVGAAALAWLALLVAVWVLFYAIELGASGQPAKVVSAKLQYLGIVGTPLAWLIFARQFASRHRWPTRRGLVALLVIP